MKRKVIVFGASGKTGLEICTVLNKKEIEFAAFVRSSSVEKLKDLPSEIINGDVLNKEDVEKALVNRAFTDVIISLGSRELKPSKIRSEGTRNIAKVLKEKDLDAKMHIISANGVRDSWNQLSWFEKLLSRLFLMKTLQDHGIQEEIALNNPGGHHIIRPVGLKDGSASGNIAISTDGTLPKSSIKRSDVAKYLVDSLQLGESGVHSISKK